MSYIYIIKNYINDKVYIGLTTRTVEIRFKEHLKLLKSNQSQLIHRAINKYGKNNFYVETLEECSENLLDAREMFYIEKYNSIKKGYNLSLGGRGNKTPKLEIPFNIVVKMCESYSEGKSLRELESDYDINRKIISNLLKANNIEIRNKIESIRNKPKIDLIELQNLLDKGYSYADIARKFKVANSSVRKSAIRNNLKNIKQSKDRSNA